MNNTTFLVIFSLLGVCLPSSCLAAAVPQAIEIYTINHEKNQEKAKKWAETKYAAWKKTVSKNEKKSFGRLLKPLKKQEKRNLGNINHQLKVYGGDLSARPIDTPIANKHLTDHVNRISRAINRKEGKLDKPLIVYKNETLKQMIHIKDQYFQNPDQTLNAKKVKKLKAAFSSGLHSEFRTYDLFEDTTQEHMIKWKIELPAGTQTGLITENKIVIDKDSAFKVNDLKIIIQKGKQFIRIDAKLVPKETVTQEIKQLTDQLQQDFISGLQLPADKKFLDFKLTGSASLFLAKKLPKLINNFLRHINHEIITKVLAFMEKKNGHIIFTDRMVYTIPEAYEEERSLKEVTEMMVFDAYYNLSINRSIILHLPAGFKKKIKINSALLFHEFGHAVDHYGAEVLKINEEELSETSDFIEIFKKEGKNLTKYGSTHQTEFFAEAFWMMHTTKLQNKVKQEAPLTYAFILQALELIADYEPNLFDITS